MISENYFKIIWKKVMKVINCGIVKQDLPGVDIC